RHVGLIFQFFNLIPVLSARDNVALPLLLTKLDKAERIRRAETALRVVGLEERLDHYPRTLSGGEQQRVAIARAIVTDPDLIVADEPTGDLDARNAEAILDLLRQLRQHFGKTVVMVTHDPRALRFVDDAYHLDKGVLLEGEEAARARGQGASPSRTSRSRPIRWARSTRTTTCPHSSSPTSSVTATGRSSAARRCAGTAGRSATASRCAARSGRSTSTSASSARSRTSARRSSG